MGAAKKKSLVEAAAAMRRRAEDLLLSGREVTTVSGMQETQKLVHELEVHRIELEMQNAALIQARNEVESALERYIDLYDFSPAGYFALDRNGAIRATNLTGCSILGVERAGLIGQPFAFFVATVSLPLFSQFLVQLFTASGETTCELTLTKKGDLPIIVQLAARASESGQECRVAIIDITKRKQVEEALLVSEERLALAASATRIGIFDWNLTSRTILWTHTHEAIFGYAPEATTTTTTTTEEHDYRRWADRVHPEDLPFVEEESRLCMQANLPLHTQYRIIWPDGSLHWVETKGVFLNDSDGRPCRLLGVVMDITERKNMENEVKDRGAAIRMAAQKLQAVMDTAPVGICVAYDSECRCITGNSLANTMLGVPKNENVSVTSTNSQAASYRVFQNGKEAACHELPLQLAAGTGTSIRDEEYEIHRQDGSQITILMSASPLFDANGITSGAIGAFQDISKRKQNDQQIQRSVEELQNLNDELIRFNSLAVGRELRMIELKKEINELCAQTGQPPRYPLEFLKE